jgi:hypothetical protein
MSKTTGAKREKETTLKQPEVQAGSDDAPAPFAYRNLYGPASVRFQSRFGSRFGNVESVFHKSRDRFSGPIREADGGLEKLKSLGKAEFIPLMRELNQLGIEKGYLQELVIQQPEPEPEPVTESPAKKRKRKRKRDRSITKAVEMRRNAPPGTDLEKFWRVVFPKCIPGHKRMTNLTAQHAQHNLRSAVGIREKRDRDEGHEIATT